MSDIRFIAGHTSQNRARDGQYIGARSTRDGALFVAPWVQALVLEGKVFGANAGSVTTGIAGHATIDADQPEMAIRAASDTLVLMPLDLGAYLETGATTLGIHELMWAVSNIDVGAGTSTAGTAFNLNMSASASASASVRVAYTGNGTDPLTAGNFLELGRQSGLIDADAATSGLQLLPLRWSALSGPAPIVARTGSIVGYAGGLASAMAYLTAIWAEFSQSDIE